MGVYINGMEMPKGKPICIIIDPAGQVRRYDLNNDKYTDDELFEAVRIPPHGDLVDRDKLRKNEFIHDGDGYAVVMSRDIRNAPTIIPADEPKEERA